MGDQEGTVCTLEVRRYSRLPRRCDERSQLQLSPFFQSVRGNKLLVHQQFYDQYRDLLNLSYRPHVDSLKDEEFRASFDPDRLWCYGSLYETMNADYHRLYDYQASHGLNDGWGRVLVPHAMFLGILETLQQHGKLDAGNEREVMGSPWFMNLEQEIALRGNRAFVKTPFLSAAHDACSRPVISGMDALLLLASSKNVIKAVREYGLAHSLYLVVLPWEDGIKEWNEFRVYIRHRRPVAICPEHWWSPLQLSNEQCYRLVKCLLCQVRRLLKRTLLPDLVVNLWVEHLHPCGTPSDDGDGTEDPPEIPPNTSGGKSASKNREVAEPSELDICILDEADFLFDGNGGEDLEDFTHLSAPDDPQPAEPLKGIAQSEDGKTQPEATCDAHEEPLRSHIIEVKPGGPWSHVSSGLFCWTDEHIFHRDPVDEPFHPHVVLSFLIPSDALSVEQRLLLESYMQLRRNEMIAGKPVQLEVPELPLFRLAEPISSSRPGSGGSEAGGVEHSLDEYDGADWVEINTSPLVLADHVYFEISHLQVTLPPSDSQDPSSLPPRAASELGMEQEHGEQALIPLYPSKAPGNDCHSPSTALSVSPLARDYLFGNYWPRSLKAKLGHFQA